MDREIFLIEISNIVEMARFVKCFDRIEARKGGR